MSKPIIIRDSVHHTVSLSSRFRKLLDSPPLQRLRYVSQLGCANQLYPGANGNRLEHSIGTYHLASLMISRIQRFTEQQPEGDFLEVSPDDAVILTSISSLDPDPEHIPEDLDIRILSNNDDVDLGSHAWASYDEGTTGVCHALIFGSNKVLISGTDERDGIQINAYEMDYPHLPGFESNQASLQFGRNSFETGSEQDRLIPEDLVVEFDADFFSSPTEGYSILEEEAAIFQSLSALKPTTPDDLEQDQPKQEQYN